MAASRCSETIDGKDDLDQNDKIFRQKESITNVVGEQVRECELKLPKRLLNLHPA